MTRNLADAVEADRAPMGTWVSIGHPTVAEALAQLDVEFLLVDMEHTTMSLETVAGMTRAAAAAPGDTAVVVRVPWNDRVRLKRVVDIGVDGVMVPKVGSAAEAEDLVEALRYPPEGTRGIAGSRAADYGRNFEEYVSTANGSIFTVAQIETEAGVENAEAVAAVDGVDALFVGPADLSGALDVFAEWDAPELTAAMDTVIAAGNAAGVPVGTLTVAVEDIEPRVQQGFDFLIAGKDTTLLMEGLDTALDIYASAREKHDASVSTD